MSWFKKAGKRRPGWLTCDVHADRVDLVHVVRGANGRPEVALCDSYRREGSETETLSRLRKEFRLEQFRCTTLLASDEYQLHQLDAPNVPEAELKTALRWKVKDVIDYPVDAAATDVIEIPGDPDAPAQARQVYVVTSRSSVVAASVQPFNDANIPLQAVDIPDLAQRNIATLFESGRQAVAVFAFYDTISLLTFSAGGELFLVRRSDITRSQLMDADAGRRNEYFERIALELQRSLDHFDRQFRYLQVEKLMLGPLPQDIGLRDYLKSNLYIPVESMDLVQVLDFPAIPELKHPERQAQCLLGIGAALREESPAR